MNTWETQIPKDRNFSGLLEIYYWWQTPAPSPNVQATEKRNKKLIIIVFINSIIQFKDTILRDSFTFSYYAGCLVNYIFNRNIGTCIRTNYSSTLPSSMVLPLLKLYCIPSLISVKIKVYELAESPSTLQIWRLFSSLLALLVSLNSLLFSCM